MLVAAAVLLSVCNATHRSVVAPDGAWNLPTFVVPAGSIEVHEAAPPEWVATGAEVGNEDLYDGSRFLGVRWLEAPRVEHAGEPRQAWRCESFRFGVRVDGEARVAVDVTWECDGGALTDLHGEVLVETREAGTDAPIRLSYRLVGTSRAYGRGARPVEIHGTREVDVAGVRWDETIRAPALPDETPFGWRDEWTDWPDGTPRARGRIDAVGRRFGTWTTWSADGIRESVSGFREGERHGEWRGYSADGVLVERGRFEDGERVGRWVEVSLDEDTERFTSGTYEDGARSGEWRTVWGDGSLCERGRYLDGRRSGFWRTYEPYRDLIEFGTYGDGAREGYWRMYHRDGSRAKSGVYSRGRKVGEWGALRAGGTPFGGANDCQ